MNPIFFVIVCFLAFSQADEEENEKLRRGFITILFKCMKETGADEDLVQQLHHEKYIEGSQLLAIALCATKKIGVLNEKGEFVDDAVDRYLNAFIRDDEKRAKAKKKCIRVEEEPEYTAWRVINCVRKFMIKKIELKRP